MKAKKEYEVKDVKAEKVKENLGFGQDENQDACCL